MTHTSDVPTLSHPAPSAGGPREDSDRPRRTWSPDPHTTWRHLISARLQLGITVGEMARRLEVTSPAISKMESRVHAPQWSSMSRYAEALGLEVVVGLRRRAVSGMKAEEPDDDSTKGLSHV